MPHHLSRQDVEELLTLGFLQYASQDYSDDDLVRAAAEFPPADWLGCGRVYHLDAENLAEGCADLALRELEAVLAANGVAIGDPQISYDEALDVTTLEVNGRSMVLCKWPIPEHASWESFSRGFFSIVNDLPSTAGSHERLYACRLYSNDQSGVLLTPRLFEKFSAFGFASDLVLLE